LAALLADGIKKSSKLNTQKCTNRGYYTKCFFNYILLFICLKLIASNTFLSYFFVLIPCFIIIKCLFERLFITVFLFVLNKHRTSVSQKSANSTLYGDSISISQPKRHITLASQQEFIKNHNIKSYLSFPSFL